jgi:hypothetical protein
VHEQEFFPGAKTFKLGDTKSWKSGDLTIVLRSTWSYSKGGTPTSSKACATRSPS